MVAALGVFAAACSVDTPQPDVVVFPDSLTMAAVGWQDEDFIWYPVSILNDTFFDLEIRGIEVVGEGADLLEVETPGPSPVALPIRQSRTVNVRVARPEGNNRTIWTSRQYTAVLDFTIGGTGRIDPETLEPDQRFYVTVPYNVDIAFEIDCDLDGDGFDAIECAGADCDDRLASVNPEAIELCDAFDNNCDGLQDNGCIDP
jgi:hypothetical protein